MFSRCKAILALLRGVLDTMFRKLNSGLNIRGEMSTRGRAAFENRIARR